MSAACPRYGFEVHIELRPGASPEVLATLLANFLADVVKPHELTYTGGGGRSARYTLSRDGTQATDADRQLVRRWAVAHATDVAVSIGPLIDLDA